MTPEKDVFTRIYHSRAWSNGSGSGSHPENTRAYRDFLQRFMRDTSVSSVVDLGCGDWQSSRLIDWSGVGYLGLDLVDRVIQHNVARYQSDSIRFDTLHSNRDDLPGADLLIVKDVLQHWPNSDIQALLPKLSGYRYALLTHTREPPGSTEPQRLGGKLNRDTRLGGHRPLDLALPPFGWPVVEVFRHASRRRNASLAEIKVTVLWTVASFRDVPGASAQK